jgi:hypothetical protein
MPTVALSSLFMALMATVTDEALNGSDAQPSMGWHDPDVLRKFNLVVPSKGPVGLVHPELEREDAVHIAELIEYVAGLPIDQKIQKMGSPEFLPVQRSAYCKWFLKLNKKLNLRIDDVLLEIGCHPTQLIERSNKDDFPTAKPFATKASADAGPLLFGSALGDGTLTAGTAIPMLTSLFIHAFRRLKKQQGRLETKYLSEDGSVLHKVKEMYEGMDHEFSHF